MLLPEANEHEDDEVSNVVQPDLLVYCDSSKLTKAGAKGAPDVVFEILSPSTTRKDFQEKFDLYERMGVREYWTIDPAGSWLNRFILGADGRYGEAEVRDSIHDWDLIPSEALPGLVFDPREIFEAE